MKRLLALLLLSGCGLGDGDRNVIENTTNINCNTNLYTEVVPANSLTEKMSSLEDVGAEVLRYDDLPNGNIAITYSVEQCNGNGDIDQSEHTAGDTSIETSDESR